MKEQFSRTALLLGNHAMEKLQNAKVAIFGVGGVGGFAVEALARSGVEHFTLIDSDTVTLTNLNRQIIATWHTIGRLKVEVMKERILAINPDAQVETYPCFYLPENADQFDLTPYTYVIDAIDTVKAKLELIVRCKEGGIPIISSMGAGNKLNPTRFEVVDISKTSVCPLARAMRKGLRQRGIDHVNVVYSKEEPIKHAMENEVPGSIAFVPSVVGLILAGEVIKEIIQEEAD